MLRRLVRSLFAEVLPTQPRTFRRRSLLDSRNAKAEPSQKTPPTFGQRGVPKPPVEKRSPRG